MSAGRVYDALTVYKRAGLITKESVIKKLVGAIEQTKKPGRGMSTADLIKEIRAALEQRKTEKSPV